MRICRLPIYLAVATMPWLVSGWAPFQPSVVSTRTLATIESTSESTVTSEGGDLNPEYQAAFASIQATMRTSIPQPKLDQMYPLLSHFAREYVAACQTSFVAVGERNAELCRPDTVAKRFLSGIQYALQWGLGQYQFKPLHKQCRGFDPVTESGNTVDLYQFGSDFFRPCIDMEKSILMGMENVEQFMDQLKQGHNVVMFANHQTEADPQVVSCLFEEKTAYGNDVAEMIFVAGHKVTTDPLAVPFSMGRNLICIHSKKHIDADPSTKSEKQKQNLRAMSAMLGRFAKGGTLIWIAPSGGRDRRNLATGDIPIAPFDSKTIDMFRLIGNKSKVPTHYYTMAMDTYYLCPPPDHVEAGVGEARNIRFVPCGIAIGNECINVGGLESRHDFTDRVFQQCEQDYRNLVQAIQSQ